MENIKLTRRGWFAATVAFALFWLLVALPIAIAVIPMVPESFSGAAKFGFAMWTIVSLVVGIVALVRSLDPYYDGKGPLWVEKE